MHRLNISYKQFYVTLNEIWLFASDPNAPSTWSEPGGKQWQRSIRGRRNWDVELGPCAVIRHLCSVAFVWETKRPQADNSRSLIDRQVSCFFLSSCRQKGGKYSRRMLVARSKTAEWSLHTPWAWYLNVAYMSSTRWMLVWHAFTQGMKLFGELCQYGTNTMSSRFRDVRHVLEHVGGWLTGAHVQFWTCWWFSHMVFTRSHHTSRCDCAFSNDKSTLVQVRTWCRQAASHYLSQCWPRSMSPYGVTSP